MDYDDSCSTLMLDSVGQMTAPWVVRVALGHQDCAQPDLVVHCYGSEYHVETGDEDAVVSCGPQELVLARTPEQVCVSWSALEDSCSGSMAGEPEYTVVDSTSDGECAQGTLLVQACD